MNSRTKGYICGIVSAVCYGTNPLGANFLYAEGMNVPSVLFTRFALAAVIIGANFDGTEEGVAEVVTMIEATGITVPALISFIAFNMLTIPCFAAVATARGEIGKGKFKWTVLFWLVTSYLVSTIVYTVGSWTWTVAIWLALATLTVGGIATYNKYMDKKERKSK